MLRIICQVRITMSFIKFLRVWGQYGVRDWKDEDPSTCITLEFELSSGELTWHISVILLFISLFRRITVIKVRSTLSTKKLFFFSEPILSKFLICLASLNTYKCISYKEGHNHRTTQNQEINIDTLLSSHP